MADDQTTRSPEQSSAAKGKARAKKEKPPAVEDKPFTDFIEQHFLPTLTEALEKLGFRGVELTLKQSPLAVQGADTGEAYWQVQGRYPTRDQRQFSIVFTQDDIKAPKFFYYTQGNSRASTIEQFMGDERKITLDLMVLYTLQRLNAQKWLVRN